MYSDTVGLNPWLLNMPQKPMFSFIIPSRNEGRLLVNTLTRMQSLDLNNCCEAVVVDDGSTVPELEGFHCAFPLTVHRSQTQLGVARARNLGASLASGSVLIFTDAHVFFSGPLFEELVSNEVLAGEGIRGFGTRLFYNHNELTEAAGRVSLRNSPSETYFGWKLRINPLPDVEVNRIIPKEGSFYVPYVGACALVISQKLFMDLGGFDSGLQGFGSLEDAELAMNCWSSGRDVKIISSVVCNHYCRPHGVPMYPPPAQDDLDHPRYTCSFVNSLRVMALHFPEDVFAEIVRRLSMTESAKRAIDETDLESIKECARSQWIEQHRQKSKKWVFERMTRI